MTHLYRHFDAEDKLLYVGVSKSAIVRLGQHEEHAHWYERITKVTIERHPSRAAALEAERIAIHIENPLCNIQRRPPPIGAFDNRKADRGTIAKRSATALTESIVWFNTSYTVAELAQHLSVGLTAANRLIESREIGSFEIEERGRLVRRVSGWQLIEFLEAKQTPAKMKKGLKQ